jgi:drug/metabolite transporter (DMT)-like permease
VNDIVIGLYCLIGWGLVDFLIAWVSRKIGAPIVLFIGHGIGLIMLIPLMVIEDRMTALGDLFGTSDFNWLLLAGVLRFVGMASFYSGLEKGSAGLTTAVSSIYPVTVLLIGVGFGIEVIDGPVVFGTFLVFTSLFLLMWETWNLEGQVSNRPLSYLELRFGLPPAVSWGFALSILAYAVPRVEFLVAVFIEQLVLVFLSSFWFFRKREEVEEVRQPSVWLGLFVIGFLEITPLLAFSYGARTGSAVLVVALSAAYPLVTAVLAHSLFEERLSGWQRFSIFLAITGVTVLGVMS